MLKIRKFPTVFIVNEIMWLNPTTKHLFGRCFWDSKYKVLIIGDETLRKHYSKYHELIE